MWKRLTLDLPTAAQQLKSSGLFDSQWYLATYSDIISSEDPIEHYLNEGAAAGLFPNSLFDSDWYAKTYRLPCSIALNPLLDYVRNGVRKNRNPNPFFCNSYYLKQYPDVAKARMNPLWHFLKYGARERRDPSPRFSTALYMGAHPEIIAPDVNALAHFLHCGRQKGFAAIPVPLEPQFDKPVFAARPWMRAGSGRSEKDERRGRAIRIKIFWLGCALYALLRRPYVAGRTNSLRIKEFLELAMGQFGAEAAAEISFTQMFLISRPYRFDPPSNQESRILRFPVLALKLFTANGLKASGFFEDAEVVYRWIAESRPLRDLALLGLGDLLLIQAMWATEFRAYAAIHAAVDPHAELETYVGESWRVRTFAEAFASLRGAAELRPDNTDAILTLALGYLRAEQWEAAAEAITQYRALRGETEDGAILRAWAEFGVDEAGGRSQFEHAIQGRQGRLTVSVPKVVEDMNTVHSDYVLYRELVTDAVTTSVRYTLRSDGKTAKIDRSLSFPEASLFEVSQAQLVPEFGTVVVGGEMLVGEATHMLRCHLRTFTTAIEAQSGNNVLMCSGKANRAPIPRACFIGHNRNYYHWLMEDVARLEHVAFDDRFAHLPILVHENIAPWQVDLLNRVAGREIPLCPVNLSLPVEIDRLVLPPRLSKNMVNHPAAVEFVRSRLVPHHRDLAPKRGKRLYLTRKSAAVKRSILNESELLPILTSAGFEVVDPGALSIDEQIKLFSDVEIIAGAGGAALTNMVFAPSTAKLLVMSAEDILCETFTSMSSALGQRYVLCAGPSYPLAHTYWVWTRFNFRIGASDLSACLDMLV